MSFTYDPSLADDVSLVRFYLDDTLESYHDFHDSELQFLIDANGSPLAAAAEAALRLYTRIVKSPTVSEVDDTRVEFRNKAESIYGLYKTLLKRVKEEKMKNATQAPMYFGGINKASFDANRNDSSLTPPDFTKGVVRFNRRHPQSTPIDSEFNSWNIFNNSHWNFD